MKNLFFIWAVFLFFLLGCSKPAPERKLEVTFAAIAGVSYSGGALFRMKNLTTNEVKTVELVAPYFITVSDGAWNFEFVGFSGPGAWAGTWECGSLENLILGPADLDVRITATAANCTTTSFQDLISTKVGIFNAAKFGQGQWGP